MAPHTGNTREALLDAAQELIQRRGMNAMSFQDLSDAVGIRKASVHHHFGCKAEMVNALAERHLTQFDAEVDHIMQGRASGRTRLKRYCNLFVRTLKDGRQDQGCLCGMLMAEMLSLDERGLHLVRQFLASNVDRIEDCLRQGIEDGSLDEKRNVRSTAALVLATLEGGLLIARCDGGPKRMAMVVDCLLVLLSPA